MAHPMTNPSERKVLTVSEITGRIKALLEMEFSSVWIEGEISNFTRATSGHLYFTLKDENAQLRCVCFRGNARTLRFELEDGLKVLARGKLSIYERRGEYQLYVELLEPVGVGALQLAFEQMKAKLQAEGLFDSSRKKPLPLYPRTVGVVTSPTGAAIRDILRILKRRHEGVDVLIYPVKVQGEGSAQEIVGGIQYFSRERNVDVVIVGRGGGSIEDLWAFNEEIVARAIAASTVPIISAVGHEVDFTIADFVADLRAPTPSAAAEIVSEAKVVITKSIMRLAEQLENATTFLLGRSRRKLLELTGSRGFSIARSRLQEFQQLFDELAYKLTQEERNFVRARRTHCSLLRNRVLFFDLRRRLRIGRLRLGQLDQEARSKFEGRLTAFEATLRLLGGKLDSLSPLKVLERGYSIVKTAEGNILKDAGRAEIGSLLSIQLARGTLKSRVTASRGASPPQFGARQPALNFAEEES